MNTYFFRSPLLFCIMIVFMLSFFSCSNPYGPKPDKTVDIILEVQSSYKEVKEVIDIVEERLDKIAQDYKVTEVGTNRIHVVVSTHYEIDRLKEFLVNRGILEFYETHESDLVLPVFYKINTVVKEREQSKDEPLYELIAPGGGYGVLFNVEAKDTAKIREYIDIGRSVGFIEKSLKSVKFIWGISEIQNHDLKLYAVKNEGGKPLLTGEAITDAKSSYDLLSRPAISIEMKGKGAKLWEKITERAYRNKSQIAIVFNGLVYSAPGVMNGPISGGRSQITGDFTQEEAMDLANILTSGTLPKIKIVSLEVKKLD